MIVEVLDLNGERKRYSNIDRVAYVNQETYGSPEKLEQSGDEAVLIVNVNGIAAVLLD